MADFSLIPERPLLFSPLLAATIGLEEAILLQHLQPLFEHHGPQIRNNYAWLSIEYAYLLRTLPFWTAEDLQRISRSLADKGVLLLDSASLHRAERLVFAVNEPAATATAPATPIPPPMMPTKRSAGLLPLHWSPSEDLLQVMSMNHTIPRQFALDQLEDFIFYWRERGETSHAWENKFRQHVIAIWRRQQQHQAEAFRVPQTTTLDNNWRPSADAMEIMERGDIERDFIEQAIPEFILYWRERGTNPKELNSKFIQHIRIQWAKYTSSLEHSTEPKRITEQWQPSEDVFDILRLSHIDTEFARSLLPEFIVYWRDSNQAHTSWNSKFIQHVKHHWAKRHQIEQAGHSHAGQQGTNTTGRTRDRSLQQDLTDTSWAE
jgi:DnaT DNA-binding domain